MIKHSRIKIVVAGLSLAVLSMVAGGATAQHVALNVQAEFAAQRAAIESKLSDGKTYAEISADDRAAVLSAVERISAALDSSAGVTNLSEAAKLAVFNDQELINNILTKAGEDSRLVCRSERRVGSHRSVNVCLTVAERRKARESAQQAILNSNRSYGPDLK